MAPPGARPVLALLVLALLYVRRKKKKAKATAKRKKLEAEALAKGEPLPKPKPDPTKVIWGLIKPKKWFAKGKDGEGSGLMATIFFLAGLRTVQISFSTSVVQVLDELMNSRDVAGFKQYMGYSIVISLFGTSVRQVWNYTSAHLVVLWRQRLTDRLHEEYFKGQAYYFLGDGGGTDGNKVKDPDQRISEDVKKTAEGFAQIFQEVRFRVARVFLSFPICFGPITLTNDGISGPLRRDRRRLLQRHALLPLRALHHRSAVGVSHPRTGRCLKGRAREVGRAVSTQFRLNMAMKDCAIDPIFGGSYSVKMTTASARSPAKLPASVTRSHASCLTSRPSLRSRDRRSRTPSSPVGTISRLRR